MSLRERINEDMKTAMKARDSVRLGAIRLLLAAVKQREIDERIVLDDAGIVGVIEKMQKQRRDSVTQYTAAGRQDLADAEKFEMEILSGYMPQALADGEINAMIVAAIAQLSAATPADMGKVIALIRPQMAGRADMAEVSRRVKAKLAAA